MSSLARELRLRMSCNAYAQALILLGSQNIYVGSSYVMVDVSYVLIFVGTGM